MHKREKLGDNFFSLFSSSSSKYGQRLSILQKKKRTYKEVFSSGVWSGKNMLSSEILGAHLFTSLISYLRQDIGIKRRVKNTDLLLIYCSIAKKTPLRSVSLGDDFFSD